MWVNRVFNRVSVLVIKKNNNNKETNYKKIWECAENYLHKLVNRLERKLQNLVMGNHHPKRS